MTLETPVKIWVFVNTPAPYQVDFLKALQETGLFSVYPRFMSSVHRGEKKDLKRLGLEQAAVCRGYGPHWWSDAFRLHPRAICEAWRADYDLYVLGGQYTSLTFGIVAAVLGARRRCWMVWLEQPWPADFRPRWSRSVASRSSLVRHIREVYLRWLVRRCSAVLAIGRSAAERYTALSGNRQKIYNFPYVCDARRFQPQDASLRRHYIRMNLGIPEDAVVFLYCGQLIERKGVEVLLQAFERLGQMSSYLIIVGDGPLRARMARPPKPVILVGSVNYDEIPNYFVAADVFVFPTLYDGWGVVVNEACSAGLPVIASSAAGAARDLIVDGDNGLLVGPGDVEALRGAMQRLLTDSELRQRMGQRAREVIADYLPAASARRLYDIARNLGVAR